MQLGILMRTEMDSVKILCGVNGVEKKNGQRDV